MKRLATLAGSVALLAAAILPAIAAGNNCSNGTTGPLSTNTCSVNNTSTVTVNNVNDAKITNNVTASSNTGHNSASKNTLGGSIMTGNATLNATISNAANVNTTTVSGGPAASGNSGTNNVTGPGDGDPSTVDNGIWITNSHKVGVDNNNAAVVNNTVNADANSGYNVADTNTGPASVRSGNTRLGVVLLNQVNDSATGISAGAGGTGGNSGSNSTTGPLSTNLVTINNTTEAGVNNWNDLLVGNEVNATSNSGYNSASKNTLGGDIVSGNAAGSVGIETDGNINTTTVDMAMGGFSNGGGNGITGPMSQNRVDLLNSQNIFVDNQNNKGKSQICDILGANCKPGQFGVFNTDNDTADSGYNTADLNTGGGDVVTGWTDLVKNLLTRLNDTLTVIKQ